MKFVALISGGKDSIFSVMHAVANDHECIALANLMPSPSSGKDELDSFMFQTVGHDLVNAIAECMGKPLYRKILYGRSKNQNSIYHHRQTESDIQHAEDHDEVEDLYQLLLQVQQEHPDLEAVTTGAVLSNYQRVRVEHVCARLGLNSLAYLWRYDQLELLQDMLYSELDAVVVKVASIGLDARHLGKTVRCLMSLLERLHAQYGVHPAGEGGEYETLTLDCPLFQSRIVIEDATKVVHSDDGIGEVAYLKVEKFRLEPKSDEERLRAWERFMDRIQQKQKFLAASDEQSSSAIKKTPSRPADEVTVTFNDSYEACVIYQEPFLIIGNIRPNICSTIEEATVSVMQQLAALLNEKDFGFHHVIMSQLYVREMGSFASINRIYAQYFGVNHPAARVCVGTCTNLPLVLNVIAIRREREIMHIQSVSYWAPANIGPYSQAAHSLFTNTDHAQDFVYLAGQIGMIPSSLDVPICPMSQVALSLQHVRSLLHAFVNNETRMCANILLPSSQCVNMVDTTVKYTLQTISEPEINSANLPSVASLVVCYVTDCSIGAMAIREWNNQFENCSFVPPLIITEVPSLPKNCCIEWEVSAWHPNNIRQLFTRMLSENGNDLETFQFCGTFSTKTKEFTSDTCWSRTLSFESTLKNSAIHSKHLVISELLFGSINDVALILDYIRLRERDSLFDIRCFYDVAHAFEVNQEIRKSKFD